MDNTLQHWGIKGMKWGVRRYQNKDGSLTPAGEKRYARDKADNLSKKKENRIDTSEPNPKRWVKEDLERSRKVTSAASELVKEVSKLERESRPKATRKKLDLSSMTDQELRQRINRELAERQYNDLFGKEETPAISKGREYVSNILEIAGEGLAVTGSALSVALAIKALK